MKKASLVIKEIQEGTYNDVLKEKTCRFAVVKQFIIE